MSYQLTQEQLDVIELAKTGSHMKLSAFAGTGKTSTLVYVAQAFAEQNRRGFYLAFNKAIADEAGYQTPSFFGYMLYSGLILLPTFGLITFLFFMP